MITTGRLLPTGNAWRSRSPRLDVCTSHQQPCKFQTTATTREGFEMTSMASPSNDAAYDYTEGASPGDIDDVVANHNQSRRPYESFYGEDGQGTMFSGPSHSINPSSVSRMSHIEAGRRSRDSWSQHRRLSHDSGASKGRLSRRDSRDSHSSHRSVASKDVEDRSDEE